MPKSNTPAVIESTATEIATIPAAALPGLYETMDTDDRMTPSLYLMQGLSAMVQAGTARPGDAVLALGNEDPDPVFLIGGPEKRDHFVGYILSRTKSYARFAQGEDMQWMDKAEFEAARALGDRDVWAVYRYVLAIPSVDDVLPARLMLTRTGGTIVARQLNTFIDRSIRSGSTDPVAVKFTVSEKVGKASGKKFFAFNVALVGGDPEGLAIARQIQLSGLAIAQENAAPVAEDQPGF